LASRFTSKPEMVRSPLPQRKRIDVSRSNTGNNTEGETSMVSVDLRSIVKSVPISWRTSSR
jgi:hypothetical protein